ncbi:uncharacterized protein LOC109708314 isoform X2 [Ananas comosus]|nr:uncharacterized protein LOC109708314 isoform X2 [Ananas comosus]XP_020085607.1 uncharacterized protein LOC109708314 isoform X2 [Ananas comosus]
MDQIYSNVHGLCLYGNESMEDGARLGEDKDRSCAISELEPTKNSKKCLQNSCPCSNQLACPNYTSVARPNKSSASCTVESGGVNYDPLDVFSRSPAFLSFPTSVISLDFIIKSLRNRRTHSINALTDFVMGYSWNSSKWDIVKSPFRRWAVDSIQAMVDMRTVSANPLASQLGNGNCDMPKNDGGVIIPLRKQTPEFSFSEKSFLSCSSITSKGPYNSASSAHNFVSTGILRCIWRSGLPYFEFCLGDNEGEFYIANPIKVNPSSEKALDYLYMFYTKTRKDISNHPSGASKLVGRMKVLSSFILDPDSANFIETEFILFGLNEDNSRDTKASSSVVTAKGFAKKVREILKPNHSLKTKYSHKSERSSSYVETPDEVIICELNDDDNLPSNLVDDFMPNFELAAIVVRNYQHRHEKESVSGGWGLKFLGKAKLTHVDIPIEPLFSTKGCEQSCLQNRMKSSSRINVVVPAGFHGGPITNSGGPSSLTERWRSGGSCDCGGWDVGCPITVFNNNSISYEATAKMEPKELNSIDLFFEGSNYSDPILRLVHESEGLCIIYIPPTLSALQCFAIGVAIIHSQASELYPKL